jgi:hypothetical protein
MPFPQPAGYYSLKLPEGIEEAIEALDYEQSVTLAHSIIYHLGEGKGDRFYSFIPFTPSSFDDAIDSLTRADKINLIRWIGDRLASLHTLPVQEVTV